MENRSPILIDDLGWSDIGENLDLASEMAEKVRELANNLKTWRKESNARMALINKDYVQASDWRRKNK